MDTFVKWENEMWKMQAKERIQTRIVTASAFIVLLLILSRISLNWFPSASGALLMVSRIIDLFISINVIVLIS